MNQKEMASNDNSLFDQSAPVIYFRNYRPVISIFQRSPQGKYNAEESLSWKAALVQCFYQSTYYRMKEMFR